jgi:hypothetical protein
MFETVFSTSRKSKPCLQYQLVMLFSLLEQCKVTSGRSNTPSFTFSIDWRQPTPQGLQDVPKVEELPFWIFFVYSGYWIFFCSYGSLFDGNTSHPYCTWPVRTYHIPHTTHQQRTLYNAQTYLRKLNNAVNILTRNYTYSVQR